MVDKEKDIIQKGRSLKSYFMEMNSNINFTRKDFMAFFRDDNKLNLLSVDDRIEVFSTILLGSSDFNKELLDNIFSDYCITNLVVNELSHG